MKPDRWVKFLADLDSVCCRYGHSLTDIEVEAESLAARNGWPSEVGPLALELCAHWHRAGYCRCEGYCDDEWPIECAACRRAEEAMAKVRELLRPVGHSVLRPVPGVSTFSDIMKRVYPK